MPASTASDLVAGAELTGVSNPTNATPSLESLPAHTEHASTRREGKERRERERSGDSSVLGGLRNSGEGELTAMAEAFRAAARQRSSKEEGDTSD